jgi:DNA-binding MurR/RpiR family transcriptional regulator
VADEDLESWLRARVPARGLSGKGTALLETALAQPRRAAFASAAELASMIGANSATVTRTAQALGFAGWPALQEELRTRYLASLSAVQVNAAHHETGDTSSGASLRRDLDNLALLTGRWEEAAVSRVAEAIAGARRTVIVAAGSYSAVGTALEHNVRLAGHEVELQTVAGAGLANCVAGLRGDETLIAITFWRLYESTVVAAQEAAARGCRVFAITDAASPALAEAAEEVLLVPAEGVAFFPSLTAGVALCQAIVARLAALDPERTAASVAAAETQWTRFGLLHRGPGT